MSTMSMTASRNVATAPSRPERPGREAGRPMAPRRARLTRRGRVVVVLVALVLLVVGFSMGRVSSQAAGPQRHAAPATVTVEPGESLWSLAARIAPHVDPRLVVDQIVALNHLPDAEVDAGEQLVVPRAQG